MSFIEKFVGQPTPLLQDEKLREANTISIAKKALLIENVFIFEIILRYRQLPNADSTVIILQ